MIRFLVLFASIFLASTASAQDRLLQIGNSLTNDTVMFLYANEFELRDDSIRAGSNLSQINDDPEQRWPGLIENNDYDFLAVQPFQGTTIGVDVSLISNWMTLEPNAVVIIHPAWNGHIRFASDYIDPQFEVMRPSPAYIDELRSRLLVLHPSREIRLTRTHDILFSIHLDIENGAAPFEQLSDLYRDGLHMSLSGGRYMAHNAMMTALGRGIRTEVLETSFTTNPSDEVKDYINQKILDAHGIVLGDCNQDGVVNFFDISPFIGFLSEGYLQQADLNLDRSVDFLDISPFIRVLTQ